jgi:hypothetical protein
MLEAIIRRLKRLNCNKRGISNVLVVMLSLILVTVIVANVVLWNYQMSQLDWEKMREKLEIINVEHNFLKLMTNSEYVLESGENVSGKYRDTWTADGLCESFRETTSLQSNYYYPGSYQLIGATRHVSGSLSELQLDDSIVMQFISYVSATSESSKTDALIAYRSNTGTNTLSSPKNKIWTGDSASWSGEIEMPTAGSPVRWVRSEYCPAQSRSYEAIVMTISDDKYYDLYVWNGTWWLTFNNIGYFQGSTFYRGFDVAYEHASGRALIVYSRGTSTDGQEIGYRIWDGSTLSDEYLLGLPYTTGIVYWIALASCPGTRPGTADDNEIAMIYIDSNVDVHGYVWNGSAWDGMGQTAVWDATAAIATEECIAVAYEQQSGRAMFIWGDTTATYNYYRIWDGSTLSGPTLLDIPAQGGLTNWVVLKADPNSNGLLFGAVDAGSDLNTAYWSGSAWTVHTEHDAAVDTHAARCFDFAWNPTGSTGLLVWGTTANSISRKTFTPPNTWGAATTATAAGTHPWVQLRTNPRYVTGDKYILGAVLNSNFDIGSITWDGATFTITEGAITADTTVSTYECFEIAFMNFGKPTEFTVEVEFSGASDGDWVQLTWIIDCSFTTDNVNTTFQLYNYTAGRYATNGDTYGFITEIIGTTEETVNQTVTINPTDFRNATSGEWKIKVKGTKTTSTPFNLKMDYVALNILTHGNDNYTLSIVGFFILDVPLASENVSAVEVQLRIKASDTLERWILMAYNWINMRYDEIARVQSSTEFNNFTVALTDNWQNFFEVNGTMKLKLCDATPDASQTTIDLDLLVVKITLKEIVFNFKNNSAFTVHIVSVWIITGNSHKRYDEDFFINPGETAKHIRGDMFLPAENFTVKVVTERGNIAVFSRG